MREYYYKIFLFHSLSGRTPFTKSTFASAARWGYLVQLCTTDWRNCECNNSRKSLSSLTPRCKLLKKHAIMQIYVATRIPGAYFLRNLVARRTLLFQLVRRDFQQRFVGSAMGWIWGLIHPLVLLLSWTFIFQV